MVQGAVVPGTVLVMAVLAFGGRHGLEAGTGATRTTFSLFLGLLNSPSNTSNPSKYRPSHLVFLQGSILEGTTFDLMSWGKWGDDVEAELRVSKRGEDGNDQIV